MVKRFPKKIKTTTTTTTTTITTTTTTTSTATTTTTTTTILQTIGTKIEGKDDDVPHERRGMNADGPRYFRNPSDQEGSFSPLSVVVLFFFFIHWISTCSAPLQISIPFSFQVAKSSPCLLLSTSRISFSISCLRFPISDLKLDGRTDGRTAENRITVLPIRRRRHLTSISTKPWTCI